MSAQLNSCLVVDGRKPFIPKGINRTDLDEHTHEPKQAAGL